MKKIIMTLGILITVVVSAAPAQAASWTQYETISIVYPYPGNGGRIYVRLQNYTTSHANSEGCNSLNWVILEKGNAVFDEMYSLILAAQYSGHQVRFNLSGCIPGNAYPIVFSMQGL